MGGCKFNIQESDDGGPEGKIMMWFRDGYGELLPVHGSDFLKLAHDEDVHCCC